LSGEIAVSRRLFIIGAGSFGRELEGHLEAVPPDRRDWEVAGFLDDDPGALEGFPSDHRVLGPIGGFVFRDGDLAVLALAKPSTKRKVFESLTGRVELLTFVAPDAIVGKFTRLGRGCVIGPRVILGPNVVLGDAVFVNSGSMVGHDATLGSFTSLMAANNVAGGCLIGEGVFAASTVTIIPGRKICDGAYLGAGSVVIQDVKEPRTVFGNPAKYV
jgi:sugar O-acyltransferase (sialic acid O-acetyltransferase NeuD family)